MIDKKLKDFTAELNRITSEEIIGVGYGLNEVGGKTLNEKVIVFTVLKKKPLSEIPEKERIPSTVHFDGVEYKTDVVEGVIEPLGFVDCSSEDASFNNWDISGNEPDNRDKQRPIQGGISITNFTKKSNSIGTLGFLAVDNDTNSLVGITNNHVIIPDAFLGRDTYPGVYSDIYLPNGNSVTQPNEAGNQSSAYRIGIVKKYNPLILRINGANESDCAAIAIEPTDGEGNSVISTSESWKQLGITGMTSAPRFATTEELDTLLEETDREFYTSGRTSGPKGQGLTKLYCTLSNSAITLRYGRGNTSWPVYMNDGFELQARTSTTPEGDWCKRPIAPGDSGSAILTILDGEWVIVGLLYAGRGSLDTFNGREQFVVNTAICNRIDNVARDLNISAWDGTLTEVSYSDTASTTVSYVAGLSEDKTITVDGKTYWQAGVFNYQLPTPTPEPTPVPTPLPPPDPFIVNITTTEANQVVEIPFLLEYYEKNLDHTDLDISIDWGDGTTVATVDYDGTAEYPSNTYATPGNYTIEVTGDTPHIGGRNQSATGVSAPPINWSNVVTEIVDWGTGGIRSLESLFGNYYNNDLGGSNSVPGTGNPTLPSSLPASLIDGDFDMRYMFKGMVNFNQDLSSWNFSPSGRKATYRTLVDGMFKGCESFNQDISSWNMTSVTSLNSIFEYAPSFNQPLNDWNTSNVTSMQYTFYHARSFNQNLSSWDTSNVTNMNFMFYAAHSFNQDIGNWDVSSLTRMWGMFNYAKTFNYSLNSWDVSNVEDMRYVFANADAFNQPLNNWDVSNVTNMDLMFSGADLFNQDISSWNVSNVTNMYYMFANAKAFNQPLNNWNVSSVTDMSHMFDNALAFNQDLNSWDVSNVTNMEWMFAFAKNFNGNISSWNVSNVTNMGYMFWCISFSSSPTLGPGSFNQDISNWDVSSVTRMQYMLFGQANFNQNLNSWDVSNVTKISRMFEYASSFNQPLNNWNVSNVTSLYGMFGNATTFNQDISSWNVSNVTEMSAMFKNATAFNQDISSWNTSNVTDMSAMFYNASVFNQDLSGWCVQQIASEPELFDDNATSWVLNKPNWGAAC